MEALPQLQSVPTVPVSSAKISPPALAHHAIDRPRLLPDASTADQMLLGVITAPAGYGKTTAAAQLAASLDPDYCWFTIQTSDNDITRFLAHLCSALRLGTESCVKIRAAVEDPARGPLVGIDVLRVEMERIPRRVVLVLDDFHKLTNPAIVSTLTQWLVVPPARFTLLCVGRTQPALPLQRTRTHGRLFELRSDQLAFTEDEIAATLFQALGSDTPEASIISAIMDVTEGWPSAAYLAGLACAHSETTADVPRHRSQIVNGRELDRYLRAVLPVSLSDDEIAFLRDTSVIDTLVPELCDALTQSTTSAQTLQSFIDNERFIAVKSSTGSEVLRSELPAATVPAATFPAATFPAATFHCHRLVRDHLRNHLATNDPARHELLYRRAVDWYQANGQFADAIRCATALRDVELGQILVAQSWRSATHANNFDAVREWAEIVGPDGTAHGSVCVILAWGAVTACDETSMRHWLARAETLSAGYRTDATVKVSRHLILAQWASLTGDVQNLLDHAKQAENAIALHSDDHFTRPGLALLQNVAACIRGIGEFLGNDLDMARDLLTTTATAARSSHDDHTLVNALGYLGLVEALDGHHEPALVYADEVIERTTNTPEHLPTPELAHLTRSIVHLSRNEPGTAQEALDSALDLAPLDHYPIQRGLMLIQKARIHHRRGSLPEARQALQLARDIARTTSPSLLDRYVRSAENELRFIGLGSNDRLPPGARELTEREIEILHILPSPLTRAEIAAQLHISENTIKTHLTAISRKLAVRGRTAIVERAVELALLAKNT